MVAMFFLKGWTAHPLPAQRLRSPSVRTVSPPKPWVRNHDPHSRACHVDSAHKVILASGVPLSSARRWTRRFHTQPVGFSRPAILQAPLPGPLGNSS